MHRIITKSVWIAAFSAALAAAAPIVAQQGHGIDEEAAHDHSHEAGRHRHSEVDEEVYKGYFEHSQIEARVLSDWEGDWQSVYPYLQDGALDPVMVHKADLGDRTADEYLAYYETGYATDVDRIIINGDIVTFR
jgi:zinc transport system substrate-binding protein